MPEPARLAPPTPAGIRITRADSPALLDAAREFLQWRTAADYGYGHVPEWHWDIDDATTTYVTTPRQALWVALAATEHDGSAAASEGGPDDASTPGTLETPLPGTDVCERVVGTVAIRTGGPKVPPHPPLFAERYPDPTAVAQLVRLMVAPDHRRRGLAGILTRVAVDFAREAEYTRVYLHTNALVPGALEFWRRTAVEVYDARGSEYDTDSRFETVHFEIPL